MFYSLNEFVFKDDSDFEIMQRKCRFAHLASITMVRLVVDPEHARHLLSALETSLARLQGLRTLHVWIEMPELWYLWTSEPFEEYVQALEETLKAWSPDHCNIVITPAKEWHRLAQTVERLLDESA